MMALSSAMVTCLALSTAWTTCCWCWTNTNAQTQQTTWDQRVNTQILNSRHKANTNTGYTVLTEMQTNQPNAKLIYSTLYVHMTFVTHKQHELKGFCLTNFKNNLD